VLGTSISVYINRLDAHLSFVSHDISPYANSGTPFGILNIHYAQIPDQELAGHVIGFSEDISRLVFLKDC
jgi:hypothetical protein